jgi:IS66 Orf2 like protein
LDLSEVQDEATQAVATVDCKARISGGQGYDPAARSRPLGRRGQFALRVSGSVQSEGTARVDRFGGASVATAMLSLSPATRVFLALAPIDGRKSFNGLSTLVQETLGQEPTSGYLFVFVNKARERIS